MRALFLCTVLLAACGDPAPATDPDKEDADGDGWPGATDCDDGDPLVNPSARELCDLAGVDEDCDGGADDADPEGATDALSWYPDGDGDGYAPEGGSPLLACTAPAGYAEHLGDCDDAAPMVSPGATEVCDADAVDEDCDGTSDDADPSTDPASFTLWYPDTDADGYGDNAASAARCLPPEGYILESGDCNDDDALISPDASEKCDPDNVDEDCDGGADNEDDDPSGEQLFYADEDGDGYGGASDLYACDLPAGYAETSEDCDDADAAISPAGTEACDDADADEDCDGLAEDADPTVTNTTLWYNDADGDGHGGDAVTPACAAPPDHYADRTDCDDSNPAVSPDAQEVCDAGDVDEDCSGAADDADPSAIGQSTWYQDLDADGYGTSAATLDRCDEPAGYAATSDDCDDGDSGVSPGEPEVCDDGVDQDCDGEDPDCPYAGSGDPEDDYDLKLYGPNSGSEYGTRLATGDFDADGVGDLVVAAPAATTTSYSGYGAVYGYYGALPSGVELATTSDDFLYYNVTSADAGEYGSLLVNVGDMDGDGADDLLIGGADDAAWLYAGNRTGSVASTSDEGDFNCNAAAAAGDLTDAAGDDDWLCGYATDNLFATDAGSVSVYEGTTYESLYIGESAYDQAGIGVAAGDVNGDGVSDVWIGANGDDDTASNAGAAYLVYGPAPATWMGLSGADAKVLGASGNNYLGTRVAAPGDMDGDGYVDLLASAPFASGTGTWEGKVYLFTTAPSGSVAAGSAAAATIVGENNNLFLGANAFTGGDVDGDGDGDLLLGATTDSDGGSSAGAAWLVYGPHGGTISLTAADASWRGDDASDKLGTDVALLPDFDGDGDLELLMSASEGDHGSYTARGALWLLDGR